MSQRRAEAARKAMIERCDLSPDFDLSPDMVEAKGYGEDTPIVDNSTKKGVFKIGG